MHTLIKLYISTTYEINPIVILNRVTRNQYSVWAQLTSNECFNIASMTSKYVIRTFISTLAQ